MKNVMTDQADGLRRLMASSSGRLVVVLGGDSSIDVASVTRNLAAALVRQGKEVLLLDEYGGAPSNDVQREGRLVLVNAMLNKEGALSPLAAQADHILVALQPNAASITQAYACIKRLHQAHALQRLRVLVNGATDAAEAQRILTNLAQTANRYLSLALEPAGWVRADPFIAQAKRLNLTVVEAFQTSPAAMDFCQIATDLLNWPSPMAKGRKPALLSGMTPSPSRVGDALIQP
jgi:flagellar biosynthesis protein FlhG